MGRDLTFVHNIALDLVERGEDASLGGLCRRREGLLLSISGRAQSGCCCSTVSVKCQDCMLVLLAIRYVSLDKVLLTFVLCLLEV